jgi:hypothetical protein
MNSSRFEAKIIKVQVRQGHAGLLYATSSQLRGLLVAQPNRAALEAEVPAAIREMLAAGGEQVVVSRVEGKEEASAEPSFVAMSAEIARKQLEADAS